MLEGTDVANVSRRPLLGLLEYKSISFHPLHSFPQASLFPSQSLTPDGFCSDSFGHAVSS